MKSYTDLDQSKKLSKILPVESADMQWIDDGLGEPFPFPVEDKVNENEEPCWSLAALFRVIRKTIGYTLYGVNNVYISCELGDFRKIEIEVYDNEVDACCEMILKLHELSLL